MSIKCFWLEDTDRDRLYLRRFKWSSPDYKCPGSMSYHDARVFIEERVGAKDERGYTLSIPTSEFKDDPRWPTHCECGYEFTPDDQWQIFTDSIYRCAGANKEYTLRDAPFGAMWNAWWMADVYHGVDGRCIAVKLPPDGHEWIVDGACSNCTMPNDKEHKCWVRYGEPPNLTVSKEGYTCGAGGGSVQTPKWHGFLKNGELVEC